MEDVGVRSRDGLEKEREGNTQSVHRSNHVEQSIEVGEQLIPGIPNEITIHKIAPKLPWIEFDTLSSVSHGWQRAIQSHQIYDARVCSKSTETLVAMDRWTFYENMLDAMDKGTWYNDGVRRIALYSLTDDIFNDFSYDLPLIPDLHKGIPLSCGSVFLDGKLYILGGLKAGLMSCDAIADVYVLDIAGQKQWKQCASMKTARKRFDCGVKDGKIYVFGGSCGSGAIRRSEVYDPKEDAWSPIAPTPYSGFSGKVTIVGEELFLHSKHCFRSDICEPTQEPVARSRHTLPLRIQDAVFAEVYHPLKNKWRIMRHLVGSELNIVSMVGGNLHRLNPGGMQAYDIHTNSWKPLPPISFGEYEPSHLSIVQVLAAVSVDNGIFAAVYWRSRDEEVEDDEEVTEGCHLIRSQGLDSKSNEIVWQNLEYFPSKLADRVSPFIMCPIEL